VDWTENVRPTWVRADDLRIAGHIKAFAKKKQVWKELNQKREATEGKYVQKLWY
jgi:hypothetical protein